MLSKEMEAVHEAIRQLDLAWSALPDQEARRMSHTLRRLMRATSRVGFSGLVPGMGYPPPKGEREDGRVPIH